MLAVVIEAGKGGDNLILDVGISNELASSGARKLKNGRRFLCYVGITSMGPP